MTSTRRRNIATALFTGLLPNSNWESDLWINWYEKNPTFLKTSSHKTKDAADFCRWVKQICHILYIWQCPLPVFLIRRGMTLSVTLSTNRGLVSLLWWQVYISLLPAGCYHSIPPCPQWRSLLLQSSPPRSSYSVPFRAAAGTRLSSGQERCGEMERGETEVMLTLRDRGLAVAEQGRLGDICLCMEQQSEQRKSSQEAWVWPIRTANENKWSSRSPSPPYRGTLPSQCQNSFFSLRCSFSVPWILIYCALVLSIMDLYINEI